MKNTAKLSIDMAEELLVKGNSNNEIKPDFITVKHFPGAVEFHFRGRRYQNQGVMTLLSFMLMVIAFSVTYYYWEHFLLGLKVIMLMLSVLSVFLFIFNIKKLFGRNMVRISQRGISIQSLPIKGRGDLKRPLNRYRDISIVPSLKNGRKSRRYQLIAHGIMGDDLLLISAINNKQHAEYIDQQVRKVLN